MTSCKICLETINQPDNMKFSGYHNSCVSDLFGSIKTTPSLNLTEAQFYQQARSSKGMSISGVQAKLGVSVADGQLLQSDDEAEYILKPCPKDFPELPANEHLTMQLAKLAGQDVALCGLIQFSDKHYAYIVKRYDRLNGNKIHQEDLMQAMGKPNKGNDSKYESSYEEAAKCLIQVDQGGIVEASTFITRVMFMYLVGNGDFHLKNTSILYPNGHMPTLTPIYDVVNTDIYGDQEFLALDLLANDEFTESFEKLGYYTLNDFFELGRRVGVPEKFIAKQAAKLVKTLPRMIETIERSYLSDKLRSDYIKLLTDRAKAFI